MRHRPNLLALGFVLAATVAVGCKEEEKLPARNPAAAASSAASSGVGGSGAESGEGGSGAGSSDGGAGGSGGAGGGATASPCVGDLAFTSVGAQFKPATPKPLGMALIDLNYDGSTQPFGILLRGAPSAAAEVASSAIFAGEYVSDAPTWGAAILNESDFGTASQLAKGTMRVATDGEPIDIPLTQITFVMATNADCSEGKVELVALIPVSAGDIELPTSDGPKTIEELGGTPGPMGGNEEGWTVQADFAVAQTSFEWSAQ